MLEGAHRHVTPRRGRNDGTKAAPKVGLGAVGRGFNSKPGKAQLDRTQEQSPKPTGPGAGRQTRSTSADPRAGLKHIAQALGRQGRELSTRGHGLMSPRKSSGPRQAEKPKGQEGQLAGTNEPRQWKVRRGGRELGRQGRDDWPRRWLKGVGGGFFKWAGKIAGSWGSAPGSAGKGEPLPTGPSGGFGASFRKQVTVGSQAHKEDLVAAPAVEQDPRGLVRGSPAATGTTGNRTLGRPEWFGGLSGVLWGPTLPNATGISFVGPGKVLTAPCATGAPARGRLAGSQTTVIFVMACWSPGVHTGLPWLDWFRAPAQSPWSAKSQSGQRRAHTAGPSTGAPKKPRWRNPRPS